MRQGLIDLLVSHDGPADGADRGADIELALALLARPSWHTDAACRGVAGDDGTNIFFPDSKGAESRHAKALCRVCPVITECRTHADTVPERHGTWAGETARQRKTRRHPGRPRVIREPAA